MTARGDPKKALWEAVRLVGKLRPCFICQESISEGTKLYDWKGARRLVCDPCLSGRSWSAKRQLPEADPLLAWLTQQAPLLPLLPVHVAKCLIGSHDHRTRRGRRAPLNEPPAFCYQNFKEQIGMARRLGRPIEVVAK